MFVEAMKDHLRDFKDSVHSIETVCCITHLPTTKSNTNDKTINPCDVSVCTTTNMDVLVCATS